MTIGYREPYRIPPASALIAFESAARHGSFSRAARELETSQSAFSRHIARLERLLSTRLFQRSRTGVSLTEAGHRYREAVVVGLEAIHTGGVEVAELSPERAAAVVIACPDEVSHLYLVPRYKALQDALGEQVRIRVLTHTHGIRHLPPVAAADVILTWNAENTKDWAIVYREAARPVCAPDYATAHAQVLSGPVSGWGGMIILDVTSRNTGWPSWGDWFRLAGRPDPEPVGEGFDSYLYVLEAAAAGRGIALGLRNFVDSHVATGALVPLADGFLETGRCLYAVLTEKGRRQPAARQCLAVLGGPA